MASTISITKLIIESGTDRTLRAQWKWKSDHTDHFELRWYYRAGSYWYIGSENAVDNSFQHNTYTAPENATAVKVQVKAVSTKKTKNGKETSYWTCKWSTAKQYTFSDGALKQPSVPSVSLDGKKLIMTLDNVNDDAAKSIWFQVAKIDGTKETILSEIGRVEIKATDAVRYSRYIADGFKYKVRCRSATSSKKTATYKSEWSDWSSAVNSRPAAPSGITKIQALSETSVVLRWPSVTSAKRYEVQYATEIRFFTNSNEVQSMTVEQGGYDCEVTGLSTGDKYYFRVRSLGESNDVYSDWTEIVSCVVGSKPSAPTTWSNTTTAKVGEDVYLRWVHNTVDGSNERKAEVELDFVGLEHLTIEVKNSDFDQEKKDEEIKISEHKVLTGGYTEGTQLRWRVRTMGILEGDSNWSDWSIWRTVDIYAAPTFTEFKLTDVNKNEIDEFTSFPMYIYGLVAPETQTPIGYHLSVTANESYDTVNAVGEDVIISEGSVIFSQYYDVNAALNVQLTPGDIDLENNVSYTIKCVASMDSGLTAETEAEFIVAWREGLAISIPNAELGELDEEDYSITITPYCYGQDSYKVTHNASTGTYTKTTQKVSPVSGSIVDLTPEDTDEFEYAFTDTDEQVYFGELADGSETYYCVVESDTLVEDVTLSVYRREFDGTFTEIQTGLSNSYVTITDLHPALDYARYRIVAESTVTGEIGYLDITEPLGVKEIVLQWDEEISVYETDEDAAMVEPPASSQMLKLPYNIDVSNSYKPDVSLVEYIGRTNPVSYYGTQRGETATWNAEIDKKDEDSLYALRRLAIWMGDVYVREPSGSGYWANVTVSFNQKHKVLTIPITLTIARVEGGA